MGESDYEAVEANGKAELAQMDMVRFQMRQRAGVYGERSVGFVRACSHGLYSLETSLRLEAFAVAHAKDAAHWANATLQSKESSNE